MTFGQFSLYYLVCGWERWDEICVLTGHANEWSGPTLLALAIFPARASKVGPDHSFGNFRRKWFGFGDTGMPDKCFFIDFQQVWARIFSFYFLFFFRFGFIFLYGLVSSSYENINSFSPGVINTVTLVNILGLQSTNERLALAHRLGSGGRSEDIGCITIKIPWSLS